MQNLKILNSRDAKDICTHLKNQFGVELDHHQYAFLMNKENKIYVVNREIAEMPMEDMRIDSLGIYFGELYNGRVRLSIEGAQLIGKTATKNILFIDEQDMLAWITGKGLDTEEVFDNSAFIIVKHKDKDTGREDILGCGRFKDGKVENLVSKSRKLVTVNY